MPARERLAQWDGLRALAVGAVALYHYLGRFGQWTPYAFPLQDWVRLGHLGVSLFFILSGFVIARSLARSRGAGDFALRRALRLLPAMIVCSLLTFVAMHVLDTPFTRARPVEISAFVPSLTFTDPALWRGVWPNAGYIDGVYWSLFVEVRFYAWAALAAIAAGHTGFVRAFCLASCCILVLSAMARVIGLGILIDLFQWLFFPRYLPLLCIGLTLSALQDSGSRPEIFGFLAVFTGLAVLQARREGWGEAAVTLALIAVALRLALQPNAMPWLGHRVLVAIGFCTYPFYLLHQNLGLAVISGLPRGLGGWAYAGLLSAIGLAILALAHAIHNGVERPVQRWAMGRLGQNGRAQACHEPAVDSGACPVPSRFRP